MSSSVENQINIEPKRSRGRPPLTDEQRIERDQNRYAKQHDYYLKNKERISASQKESKNLKYAEDPEFRKRAIDYITAYNRRRTVTQRFIESWKDPEFHTQLQRYLAENV
tara:strand:- start:2374 stop:2703 length:330 start_codon:yes stop_codon:yes gene_type:complete